MCWNVEGFEKPIQQVQINASDLRWQSPGVTQQIKDGSITLIKNQWHLWVFPGISSETATSVIITSTLDNNVLNQLENGAKVLLQPNNKHGSFPTLSQWFLRGGPFINRRHVFFKDDSPFDFNSLSSTMVELQHFDLASDVIPDINYLEEIDPS